MTAFWLIGTVLILVALALVLPPLLRKPTTSDARRAALDQALASGVLDADEYEKKRAALDTTVPGQTSSGTARLVAVLVAVLIPLVAVGLYAKLGDPRVFDPDLQSVNAAMQQARHDGMPPLEQAIAGLAERLAHEPGDIEGWILLGRAYKSTEQFDQARDALAHAMSLAPEEPGLMVEYAEAKTLAAPDRRFTAEALDLIERALELDPDNQRALWLRGIAHYQAGEIEAAGERWNHLLTILPEDSPVRASVQQQLAELSGGTVPEAGKSAPASASTGPRLTVHVSLDPALAGQVPADAVLFVFARAPEGSRAPLAIQRLQASQLPVTVELDDRDAMVPAMNLSSAANVVVGARISRSGNAQAQPDDLEAVSKPLSNTHAEPIELVIGQARP